MFNKYFIIVYIYFFLSYLIINIKILNIIKFKFIYNLYIINFKYKFIKNKVYILN